MEQCIFQPKLKENRTQENLLYFRKQKPQTNFLYFLKRKLLLCFGKLLIFEEVTFRAQ